MLIDSSGLVEHPSTVRAVAVGTVIRDRFLLEEELEYGRFGVVYRAVDRLRLGENGQGHHVALLVMPAEVARNAQVLERFKHDFVQVQSLAHLHIVKVFDLDRDGDLYFITMELVDGETLRCIVDSLRPERLWEEEAFAVIRAIGDALVYAHSRGVIHGDVRLENVVVTAAHDVKLLFTSACLVNSAPFSVDPRDDVHGLACLAYELLAGEAPFVGRLSSSRQRGVEPMRIKTLSRQQWKALHTALVGRDERTRSVSQFLADFAVAVAPEERPLPSTRRKVGWRFVATAWLVVFLGAGYLLVRGAPEPAQEPLAQTPTNDLVGLNREQSAATDATPPPALSSASVPNLNGRASTLDGSAPLDVLAASSRSPYEPSLAPTPSAGTIEFTEAAITTSESEGVVTLHIERNGGANQVSIVWWTAEGTAREAEDFADFGQVVEVFRSGEERRTISIPITSDRVPEASEFFRVHLRMANPADAALLGEITQTTVTLIDDD